MYIENLSLLLPQVPDYESLKNFVLEQKKIQFSPKYVLGDYLGDIAIPQISREHPYYPKPQDLKILRTDTIAAIIAGRTLVEKLNLDQGKIQKADLWISTGNFAEKLLDENSKLVKYLTKAYEIQDRIQRLKRIYRVIPPMLGLNTLTNATESYVAQYLGIKGRSTTVGNTSASSFYVIQKAISRLKAGETDLAIAGGSVLSDDAELLLLRNYLQKPRAITGAAFLALTVSQTPGTKAQIENLFQVYVDALKDSGQVNVPAKSKMLIYSNPFNSVQVNPGQWEQVYRFDQFFGYTGSISMFVMIAVALAYFELEQAGAIDCLDVDPLGRISFLTIKRISNET